MTTTTEATDMAKDLEERGRGFETTEATQTATADAETIEPATMAGQTGTMAASHSGNVKAIVVGIIGLTLGIYLGMTIARK